MTTELKKKNLWKYKLNFFYKSYWLAKFTNKLMLSGKKSAIEKMIFFAFKKLKLKHHKKGLSILFLALTKNRPLLWFAPIRLGREVKRVPIPISARRQLVQSLSWFVRGLKLAQADEKKASPLKDFLFQRLKSILFREKTNVHKRYADHVNELVENRVNMHHRWKIKK